MLKCASHIEYLLNNAQGFMEDEELETPQFKSFVTHDSIGPCIDIVPWNFPFWMPFKSMTAPLLLGNPILMKHAPSTPLSAAAIEKLFIDAGFDGEY